MLSVDFRKYNCFFFYFCKLLPLTMEIFQLKRIWFLVHIVEDRKMRKKLELNLLLN